MQAFHMRCLRCLLSITWQEPITNEHVLSEAGVPSMFAILTQRTIPLVRRPCLPRERRTYRKRRFVWQAYNRDLARGTATRRYKGSCKLKFSRMSGYRTYFLLRFARPLWVKSTGPQCAWLKKESAHSQKQ